MILLIAGLIVLALAACILGLLGVQLMQQSGRILERVETLEHAVMTGVMSNTTDLTPGPGLPSTSVAPSFELTDLSGQPRSSGEWSGRRILVIFFDPASHHCLKLLDSLQLLGRDVTIVTRPSPLIISIGDPDQARRLFDGRNMDVPVLLSPDAQVAAAYLVDATPSAYIVSEDGLIEGNLVYGTQAVLVAAGEIGEGGSGGTAAQRLAADDQVAQDGLRAGAQAPIFRLPKVGGGEVSLLEYRGKDTLLVFSDPACEPCLRLLPELARVAEKRPELAVVVISRGNEAANIEHVASSNGAYPVALQRNWEISRDYGLMATPIAYMIDEWGMTVGEPVIGNDAILELISEKS